MQIEVGKLYRTRAGERVRIYATDGSVDYPIHGAIGSPGVMETWKTNGRVCEDGPAGRDIVCEWDEPEPTEYRPYIADELPVLVGRVVRTKTVGVYRAVGWVIVEYGKIWLVGADDAVTPEDLLDRYEWADGSACGVGLGQGRAADEPYGLREEIIAYIREAGRPVANIELYGLGRANDGSIRRLTAALAREGVLRGGPKTGRTIRYEVVDSSGGDRVMTQEP